MHGKLKFLHMANFFSTSLASEASDKYEVCAIVHCLWAEMPLCLQSWHVCELILYSNDFLHYLWGVIVVFKKHICLIANSQDDRHQSVDYKCHLGK